MIVITVFGVEGHDGPISNLVRQMVLRIWGEGPLFARHGRGGN